MTDPVRPVAPREAEWQQLKTLNSALLCMIRRLQANLHFDPATRCYSVSEVAWFSQPYMGKTLARWLDAELLAAAPVQCAASPADPWRRLTDEQIRDALFVVLQSWNRCQLCGGENDDEHDSLPHDFDAPSDLDLVAMLKTELLGATVSLDPHRRLDVLIEQTERDAQAWLSEAADYRRFGKDDARPRELARVHHYFVTKLKNIARLRGEATVRPEDWRADYDEAKGYLSRMFLHCAPQCTALPTLVGICTQIDNYIAGLREKVNEKPSAHAPATVRVEE